MANTMSQTAHLPSSQVHAPLKHSSSYTLSNDNINDSNYPPLQPKNAFNMTNNTNKSPASYILPQQSSVYAPTQHSYDSVARLITAYNMSDNNLPQQPIVHTNNLHSKKNSQPLILHSISCQTELQRSNRLIQTDIDLPSIELLLHSEQMLNDKYDTMRNKHINEIQLLNQQLNESKLLHDNLEAELSELHASYNSQSLTYDTLTHQLGTVTQQYNNTTHQLTNMTTQYNVMTNKAKLLENTLTTVDKNHKKILLYIDHEINEKLNKMYQQVENVQLAYKKLYDMYTSLINDRSALKSLQVQYDEQQNLLSELRDENNNLKLQNESLQNQLDRANQQIADLTANTGCCAKSCCTLM